MKRFNLIVVSLVIVAVLAVFILMEMSKNVPDQDNFECNADTDCVPAQCCHSDSCVSIANKPDCKGMFCTEECQGGTMDCGCGSCACVNHKCQVTLNRNNEWC